MADPFVRVEAGSTRQFTWVGSATASTISLAIFNSSGTLISSATAAQSGTAAAYYRFWTSVASPDAYSGSFPARYVAEWRATIDSLVYLDREEFEVIETSAKPF